MRKIKELEERIDRLESMRNCDNKVYENRDELNSKWLMDIEAKQKEQEEFLKNTVAPFIANSLAKELDKGLTAIIDALCAEKPKKKENKKADAKKTSKVKTKKESK